MPIEHKDACTVFTGNAVDLFRLTALRGALKLEILGMKRRGRPASVIIREEFGWRERDRKALLQRLDDYIKAVGPGLAST